MTAPEVPGTPLTPEREAAIRSLLAVPMVGSTWSSAAAEAREWARVALSTLDATRAALDAATKRAEAAERERDHHKADAESWYEQCEDARTLALKIGGEMDAATVALAAAQAELVEARNALDQLITHVAADACTCDTDADGGYSCPIRIASEALSRPASSMDALRTWSEKVWNKACESTQVVERAYASGAIWLMTKEQTRERDLNALLPPAPVPAKEGGE